jgi:transcriptional regulator with XRE-family HTH domain
MPADTPAVARRRVRLALRAAREAKGLTQGEVADAMEWSLSKVMRIEKGDVSVAPADLRVLLAYLGVSDPATVKGLLAYARVARSERRAVDPQEREHLTPALVQLMQFEQEATAIRYYGTVIVPGPLQTPAYAEAILDTFGVEEPRKTILVDARQRRRQEVLYRKDPPDCLVILDQGVLQRQIGGPAATAEQLRLLMKLIEQKRIFVRVVPFAAPATIAILGPFALLDLDGEQDAILYRESLQLDEIVHTPSVIARHREIFNQLWQDALGDGDSLQMIAVCIRFVTDRGVGPGDRGLV